MAIITGACAVKGTGRWRPNLFAPYDSLRAFACNRVLCCSIFSRKGAEKLPSRKEELLIRAYGAIVIIAAALVTFCRVTVNCTSPVGKPSASRTTT